MTWIRDYNHPMGGVRLRLCAKCGEDVSGTDAEYARAEVRMWHGNHRSEKAVALALCPMCAEELAASIADWAGVAA